MVEKDILSTLTHEMTGSSPACLRKKLIYNCRKKIQILESMKKLENPQTCNYRKMRSKLLAKENI